MKIKNFLTTAIIIGCIEATSLNVFAACPYCDTQTVRSLEKQYHNYKDGQTGNEVSHAQVIAGQMTIGDLKLKIFDGNPINLPGGSSGVAMKNNNIVHFTWAAKTTDGGQIMSTVDLEAGVYQRYDGQTLNFDPSWFGTIKYDNIIEDYRTFAAGDLRILDWMVVNQSQLPQPVIDKLNEAVNYSNTRTQKRMSGENYNHEDKMVAECKELALEMLYGLIPMNTTSIENAAGPGTNT